MTKEEARGILGVDEGANRQVIEARYARLIKGYKDNPARLGEINEAYRTLTVETRTVKVEPRLQKQVFGKTLYWWKNFFHYAKVPIIVGILATALAVAIIVSMVRDDDPDFIFMASGPFYNVENNIIDVPDDLYTLRDFAADRLGVQRPLLDVLTIGGGADPNMEMAAITKRVLYIGGMAPSDVMLWDTESFQAMEEEGIFLPLDSLVAELEAKYSAEELSIFEPVMGRSYFRPDGSPVPEDELSDEQYIVGLDFSEDQIFNGLGLLGYTQILTVSVHNEDTDLAFRFIDELIAAQDQILARSPGLVNPSPTPTPVPSPPAESEGSSPDAG